MHKAYTCSAVQQNSTFIFSIRITIEIYAMYTPNAPNSSRKAARVLPVPDTDWK